MSGWIIFIIGLVIGACVGFLFLGLFAASQGSDLLSENAFLYGKLRKEKQKNKALQARYKGI